MSKAKVKTQPCIACSGVMRYEARPEVLTYKGHQRTIQTLGWWCTSCDEGILSGEPLAAQERAFLELKAEVDDVLSPSDVVAVREKLGLSQRKASELLGGGPRAFQKYEKGTQAVSVPMSNLLRLLANDPRRLEELKIPGAANRGVAAPRAPSVHLTAGPRKKPARASRKKHARKVLKAG